MLATNAAQDQIKIRENIKTALAKKKATEVKLGPPEKTKEIEQVRILKAAGMSNRAVARAMNISPSTVTKYIQC